MSGAVEGVALLPCPFCGDEAHLDEERGCYQVHCRNEQVCVAPVTGFFISPQQAAEQWNTRITPPARSYADGVEDAAKVVEAGSIAGRLTSGRIAAAIRLLSQGGKA